MLTLPVHCHPCPTLPATPSLCTLPRSTSEPTCPAGCSHVRQGQPVSERYNTKACVLTPQVPAPLIISKVDTLTPQGEVYLKNVDTVIAENAKILERVPTPTSYSPPARTRRGPLRTCATARRPRRTCSAFLTIPPTRSSAHGSRAHRASSTTTSCRQCSSSYSPASVSSPRRQRELAYRWPDGQNDVQALAVKRDQQQWEWRRQAAVQERKEGCCLVQANRTTRSCRPPLRVRWVDGDRRSRVDLLSARSLWLNRAAIGWERVHE